MYVQYKRMMVERGGGTRDDDGCEAFNAIATEDTTALTKCIVSYAEWLTRSEARVNEIQACMEAMALHQQPLPLGLGLPAQAAKFANNAVYQPAIGPPPGSNSHQEYAFYAPQEQTT